MTYANPFASPVLSASVQSAHRRRISALDLLAETDAAATVVAERLINERTVLLQDGRRVSLRHIQLAPAERRPSRARIKQVSDAIHGIPAKLVNIRNVGAGVQGDLYYEIHHVDLLPKLGLPDHQATADIADIYMTLGILLAGLGYADVDEKPSSNPILRGHHGLLKMAKGDAQKARMGVWAPLDPSAALLRRFLEP